MINQVLSHFLARMMFLKSKLFFQLVTIKWHSLSLVCRNFEEEKGRKRKHDKHENKNPKYHIYILVLFCERA